MFVWKKCLNSNIKKELGINEIVFHKDVCIRYF